MGSWQISILGTHSQCTHYSYIHLTTLQVVFVEGWHPVANKTDTFILIYGAADSVVGVAELTVTIEDS